MIRKDVMEKDEIQRLFKQHYAKMYRVARTMLYDEQESEDVVSDIFESLLRGQTVLMLLNIQGYIEPYYRSGFHIFKTSGSLNLRLSRQFLKDKSLSVAVLANDILHTRYTEMTAYGGINVRTQFKEYRDGRRIGIDLSWKFNATRSRYKGSHAGQSERNRL
ncbi:MAG: outer membrane beta-barrel protein [Bacteroidaceae bacterium]|nr:outer membrane beta-barrel protein [Bacteroidaceae bacterium]